MSEHAAFEVIISTCDKFSDLWDAHMLLLNQNWKNRGRTYLVTDVPTDRCFDGVEVVCAGEGKEITERLRCVLTRVETKYILFTMDDYFLTEPIDHGALQRSLAVMETENLDYLRLYRATEWKLRREGAVELAEHPGYYLRNVTEGNYKISLYPGLWRTDFMRKTLQESMNAWQYEVALTEMALRLNARCAISNHGEFPFLDVIRKGKVLRKAQRYFDLHPIYHSERSVMTAMEEWKLGLRTWLGSILPKPIFRTIKSLMLRCGMQFYSPVK